MTTLHDTTGDLKLTVNELDVDILIDRDSCQLVSKDVQAQCAEYLEKKLPSDIERGIRLKDETPILHQTQYAPRVVGFKKTEISLSSVKDVSY